jgi:hypothetical protein
MGRFFCEFRRVAALLLGMVSGTVLASDALAIQCEKLDSAKGTLNPGESQVFLVVITDVASNYKRAESFWSAAERDAALSKCRQLAEVHDCTKIGTNIQEIYGYDENIKEFRTVNVYGHTLQNSFAQLFRSGWGELNACRKDLLNAIAEHLR